MQLRPGDVVLVMDDTLRQPKHKRLVCVVAAEGWFFRINSNPFFRPHLPALLVENPGCLDHDSYIELRGVLDCDLDDLAELHLSGQARVLGHLGRATIAALLAAVAAADTLNPREKAAIAAAFATG